MSIIIKPVVSEKMTKIGEKHNRVAFRVRRDANKIEIKKAVEALYNVTVECQYHSGKGQTQKPLYESRYDRGYDTFLQKSDNYSCRR